MALPHTEGDSDLHSRTRASNSIGTLGSPAVRFASLAAPSQPVPRDSLAAGEWFTVPAAVVATYSLAHLPIVCLCGTVACSPHRSRSSILAASRSIQPLTQSQSLLFLSAHRCSSSFPMAPRSTVVHALLFGVLGAVALSFTWSMVLQWVVKVRLDTARQQRQH